MGPILDPTLYRQYIYDPEKKGQVIQEIIRAALPLKQAILKGRKRYEERMVRHPAARPDGVEETTK